MLELGALQQSALSLVLQFSKLLVCRSHYDRNKTLSHTLLAVLTSLQ